MKKLILCFIFSLFLAPAVGKEKSLYMSTTHKGNASLVCSEVLRHALKLLDIELEIVLIPSARSLSMSNSGRVDGEVGRISGLEGKYANLVHVSVPCYSNDMYFYVKSGREFKVDGWNSIPKDYVLGYRRGVQFIEIAAKKFNFDTYPLNNVEQIVGLLNVDKIDVMIGAHNVLRLIENVIPTKQIVRLESAVEHHKFYSYLHKRHQHLLPELNKVLMRMEMSGLIESIKHRYLQSI